MGYLYTDMPDIPDTTYRSKGVHKNRDNTAKMNVDAMDRNGVTDSQKAAAEAAAEATAKNLDNMPKGIGVDERIGQKNTKDVQQEHSKMVNETSAANVSRVEPGQFAWWPTPGQGTQASYGDGAPQGGNSQQAGMDIAAAGAEGYMSGGGQGAQGGMMGAMSSQIGQDIASKDDSIDQATEALFQDDTVGEAHRELGEKLQGR